MAELDGGMFGNVGVEVREPDRYINTQMLRFIIFKCPTSVHSGPSDYKSAALPTELCRHKHYYSNCEEKGKPENAQ